MPLEDRIYPLLKHYVGASQPVKSVLGRAYNALPLRWRYGAPYQDFMRDVDKCIGNVSARDAGPHGVGLRDEVDRRITATLEWAADTVPAYAAMRDTLRPGMSGHEWLEQFPLLSKQDVKADTERFLSRAVPVRERLPMHTGGSMSIPMRIYVHKFVSRAKDHVYHSAFNRIAGITKNDTIIGMRGASVPGADRPGGQIWLRDPIKHYLQFSNNHLKPEHMPRYVDAMRRFKPAFIHAYPSSLEPLARWLSENPAPDVTGRIRCIQLFSESVLDYQIDLFERVFGCPVIIDYGHSERAVKAISLPGDKRHFFWPLYGQVELFSFDGMPITEPGVVGEIVATGFDNKVMPLVRYRTGDLGCWSERPNLARPGFRVMDRIEGRLQGHLVCRNNRVVSITSMCAAHFEVLVTADQMQFEQLEPGKAILKIVSATPLPEHVKTVLKEGIRNKTQGGLDVEPIRVDQIARTPSGKHLLLQQHLDIASLLQARHSAAKTSGAA